VKETILKEQGKGGISILALARTARLKRKTMAQIIPGGRSVFAELEKTKTFSLIETEKGKEESPLPFQEEYINKGPFFLVKKKKV